MQAELDHARCCHARAIAAAHLERAHLRRLLDDAREERDAAREALGLWAVEDYDAAETVERVLARERRAIEALVRVEQERDRAYAIAHDLALALRRGDVVGELVEAALGLRPANRAG